MVRSCLDVCKYFVLILWYGVKFIILFTFEKIFNRGGGQRDPNVYCRRGQSYLDENLLKQIREAKNAEKEFQN